MPPDELPLPPHFDPARVGQVWRVPYGRRAEEAEAWARTHGLRPAAEDAVRICLVAVDCQNTFCMPEFELFVAGPTGNGAVEDNVRLCEFLYRNLGRITRVAATMDTHMAMQIFHPLFWVDGEGRHPVPNETVITAEDVERGVWRVNPDVAPWVAEKDVAWLRRYALHYARELTEHERYSLFVWPYHAMLGGIGHALVPAVEEALFFHGVARRTQPLFEVKGSNPLTEHYSALGPEVREGPEGERIGEVSRALLGRLLEYDAMVIAGQAKSHCVSWTVHDLLSEIQERDPQLAEKVYLLEDCTSPVVVPGADFTDEANAAFRRFEKAGMHIVRAGQPMREWSGLDLG